MEANDDSTVPKKVQFGIILAIYRSVVEELERQRVYKWPNCSREKQQIDGRHVPGTFLADPRERYTMGLGQLGAQVAAQHQVPCLAIYRVSITGIKYSSSRLTASYSQWPRG